MPEPLTIAVAQPACAALDVAVNARVHADTVRSADARLVVFPELSLTGYELAAPAVGVDDPRLAPLVAACATTGSTALVGAPVDDGTGGRSIGVLRVDGTGASVVYRKIWLGAEEAAAGFRPGVEPSVLMVDGWRLGLAVCRDTRFPEHAGATAALGIDAYVSGIVHGADEAELHVQRAERVIADHGVAVVTASFAGATGEGYDRTAGRSAIWAADGTCLAMAGTGPGELARATLA